MDKKERYALILKVALKRYEHRQNPARPYEPKDTRINMPKFKPYDNGKARELLEMFK